MSRSLFMIQAIVLLSIAVANIQSYPSQDNKNGSLPQTTATTHQNNEETIDRIFYVLIVVGCIVFVNSVLILINCCRSKVKNWFEDICCC